MCHIYNENTILKHVKRTHKENSIRNKYEYREKENYLYEEGRKIG